MKKAHNRSYREMKANSKERVHFHEKKIPSSRFSMVSDQQLSSWICVFYNGPKFANKPTCRVKDCKMQHKYFNNEKEYLESPAYRHFILKDDSVVGQVRTKSSKPPQRGRSPSGGIFHLRRVQGSLHHHQTRRLEMAVIRPALLLLQRPKAMMVQRRLQRGQNPP